MCNDGTFVSELAERMAKPAVLDVGEGELVTVVPEGFRRLEPQVEAQVQPLRIGTLSGLAKYLEDNRDKLAHNEIMVHVENANSVLVRTGLGVDGAGNPRRDTYLAAGCFDMVTQQVGRYCGYEEFVVWLRTAFEGSPERQQLLDIIGSITSSDVREDFDNGITQKVETKKGVAFKDVTAVNPVWALRGFRTFREVTQPASLYLLRIKHGSGGDKPVFMLSECDGRAWELEAMANIGEYLRSATEGIKDLSILV